MNIVSFFKKTISKFSPIDYLEIALYLIILIVFLSNSLYVTYPDEFVNLLGGQYINDGNIPYKQFFDHHLPFAWYLAAAFLRFSFSSYVIFRLLWAFFMFGSLFSIALYFRKNHLEIYRYYLAFFFIFPFVTVYYWLHLYLADSLAFLFFSVIFWLIISETYQLKKNIKLLYLISFLNFLFLFSSLSYIYIVAVIYLWLLYLLIRKGINKKEIVNLLMVAVTPYIVYLLYLVVTGTLKDFYIANFTYNTKLYISIPNYTKGRFFNPIKFALTLIYNFFQNYLPVLVRIKEFDLYFPTVLVLSFGSFLLLLAFLIENKLILILYFLVLSFSAPRSNVFKIPETDYQAGVYIALGLASAFIVLWRYRHIQLKEEIFILFKKVTVGLLFFYLLFASLFLIKNTYDKFYLRYTQKMPGIYDLAYTASFIDDILKSDEYYWVGPYEPNELFFVKNARLPGKFISLLPQFKEDEYFRSSFINQFEEHPPKIIIYKHEASIFMTPAMEFGDFFVDWMKDKYTSIEHIDGVTLIKSPSSFNFRTDLYILNSAKQTVLNRLRTKGYIE